MTRPRILDFMQNYRFWLFDIVPSAAPPFFVLGTPVLGFQTISAPEYTAEVDEIKQCNSMFKRHAYSGGGVSPITLTRGVRGFDDTFWDWMYRAIRGIDETQRHLLLLHYTNINYVKSIAAVSSKISLDADFKNTPLEIASFVPGKAWILWNCIPTRYRAGSGFDGSSSDVSIAELEVQPDAFLEMALMDPF
jgi:phage tail-like protein